MAGQDCFHLFRVFSINHGKTYWPGAFFPLAMVPTVTQTGCLSQGLVRKVDEINIQGEYVQKGLEGSFICATITVLISRSGSLQLMKLFSIQFLYLSSTFVPLKDF